MKKLKYFLALIICFLTVSGFSQMLGPEDPGSGPEAGDDPIGGSAPIGSGIVILLSLGAAYGGKKLFYLNKLKSR